jgi:hypothetical protein
MGGLRQDLVRHRIRMGRGIDWDEALRLHEEDGLNYAQIAERFGYARVTVRDQLAARGARPHILRLRGERDRKLHGVWMILCAKCHRPTHATYALFGGRGIAVCAEWRRSFEAFRDWARASGWKPGLRIARKNSARNFTPSNCVWITASEDSVRRGAGRPRGGKGTPKARIDWEEAARLYREERLSYAEVARRYGARPSSIGAGLRQRGVKRAPQPPAPTMTPEGYRIHKTWIRLHRHCGDEGHPSYQYYGARGVRVSREWSTFPPFLEWALATGSRPNMCLVRSDPNKGYSPSNCEWVTRSEVYRRRRRPGPRKGRVLITAWGQTKSLAAWSRDPRCQVTRTAITKRLDAGATPEEAINAPSKAPRTRPSRAPEITAFGVTKGLADWLRDRRCRIGATGLQHRLDKGWSPEDAITTPPYEPPRSTLRKRARR